MENSFLVTVVISWANKDSSEENSVKKKAINSLFQWLCPTEETLLSASPVWAVQASPPPPCWSSSWSSSPACAGVQRSLWVPARWSLCWASGWPGSHSHPAQAAAPQPHLQTQNPWNPNARTPNPNCVRRFNCGNVLLTECFAKWEINWAGKDTLMDILAAKSI